MPNNCNWIIPEWPAPSNVKALSTVRTGGYSQSPYDSFNLALHVEDDAEKVLANRELLKTTAKLPAPPFWLKQIHSTIAVEVPAFDLSPVEADASFTFHPNRICAVMSADCLPIIICNKTGTVVSAIHAGWRGLAGGIIEETLKKIACIPNTLLAWLGPAIGSRAFEVKENVLLAFKGDVTETTFQPAKKPGVWYANLYELARQRLNRLGMSAIYGGEYCTYQESERFYSFRRSGITGRQATLIWMTPP